MWLLAGLGCLGSLFFFDFGSFGAAAGLNPAWLLLFADVMNFGCLFQLSGFMDGLATQAAVPDSMWSLQNYILMKYFAIQIPRAVAPPLVRWGL